MKMKANKFNAKKIVYDNITFDSIKECNYYKQLLLLQKAARSPDRVVNIELQPRYDIVINNKKIGFYKGDFKVEYADGRTEIIDVKGYKKGAAYNLFKFKKKIVEALYEIEIIEK
jgi:hypothetical protein